MIKITNEINGKKYELVKSECGCEQCDFQKFCTSTPCWNEISLCFRLDSIWKEVRDAD
jgi:hypothetical protein